MSSYRLEKGSVQWQFQQSHAKLQMFGGGYGNGKTAAVCIKALRLGQMYPGLPVLMARETLVKLNDTLRKEFLRWCPPSWIKRKALSAENVIELKNGTTYHFRYVVQQGKSSGEGTSNLLSATYGLIVVDQLEDPGITEKDFDDLLGRLRDGSSTYVGTDPHMPRTGPRWFLMTCNPTRNWVYHKLVQPLHTYQSKGIKHPKLLVDGDSGEPLMELFEGATYTNKALEADYIKTLEAAYRGQQRDRFLLGKWVAYEGLVYPMYDMEVHMVTHDTALHYFHLLKGQGYSPTMVEGYDYGMAKPSCYLVGFVDVSSNLILLDGFYQAEMSIHDQQETIHRLRRQYGVHPDNRMWADPAIFRRAPGQGKTVGHTVADMFREYGIIMQRADNSIENGITKVQSYLHIQGMHRCPFTNNIGAPYLYHSDKVMFVADEMGEYYWARAVDGQTKDMPQDHNDHAMDTIKYMLTKRPRLAKLLRRRQQTPAYMRWHEYEDRSTRSVRNGR